jgi:hypothetical protein
VAALPRRGDDARVPDPARRGRGLRLGRVREPARRRPRRARGRDLHAAGAPVQRGGHARARGHRRVRARRGCPSGPRHHRDARRDRPRVHTALELHRRGRHLGRVPPAARGRRRRAWAPCTSPRDYGLAGEPDGAYVFSVRAIDTAGQHRPGRDPRPRPGPRRPGAARGDRRPGSAGQRPRAGLVVQRRDRRGRAVPPGPRRHAAARVDGVPEPARLRPRGPGRRHLHDVGPRRRRGRQRGALLDVGLRARHHAGAVQIRAGPARWATCARPSGSSAARVRPRSSAA